MASTYSTSNRLEKQGTGENSGTWGSRLNDNTIELIDEATNGVFSKSLTGNYTLSTANGSTDEARHMVQVYTDGGLSSAPTITIPAVEKVYVVHNKGSTYSVNLDCGGTAGEVPASTIGIVYCDGTDVFVATDISTAAALLALLLTVDGASSGLDADLLDGAEGAAYAKLADAETVTSNWTMNDIYIGTATSSVSDDSAEDITPSGVTSNFSGILTIGAPNDVGGYVLVEFTSVSTGHINLIGGQTTQWAVGATSGAPSGTDGSDGKATVFLDASANKVYVENRLGGSRTFRYRYEGVL